MKWPRYARVMGHGRGRVRGPGYKAELEVIIITEMADKEKHYLEEKWNELGKSYDKSKNWLVLINTFTSSMP